MAKTKSKKKSCTDCKYCYTQWRYCECKFYHKEITLPDFEWWQCDKYEERVKRMTEYKAIVKMKIPEVQFYTSDNLTQEELESEAFKEMFDTVYAKLGKLESECSLEELISELFEIQIERVNE